MESNINRKIILGVAGILVVLVLVSLYFIFFKTGQPEGNLPDTPDSSFPSGEGRDVPGSTAPNFLPLNSGGNLNTGSALSTNNASSTYSTLADSPDLLLTGGKFLNLVPEPVASATILAGTSTNILYLEQATGNLYKISLLGEEKARLSFTTISGPRQVVWGGTTKDPLLIVGQDSLNGLVFNWFKLISSEAGTTTSSQLTGSSTPNGYYTFSSNPSKSKVVSLRRDKAVVTLYLSDFSFTKPEKLSSLDFGDWKLNWFKEDLVALETRASSLFPGSLYFFNLKTKALDKIIGGINGLITNISPDGNYIIYSGMEGDKLLIYLYNLKNGTKTLLTFSTLADKCSWSYNSKVAYCAVPQNLPRGQYPDSWYKGLLSTTDDFWQVEVASSTTKIIAETGRIGAFDVYRPFLDLEGETLFFINKKDLSLWSFDVRESF